MPPLSSIIEENPLGRAGFDQDASGNWVPTKSSDPTASYKPTNLDTSGSPMYFGYLDKDANWYIMQLSVPGAGLYAKGSVKADYTACWDVNGHYVGGLTFATFDLVF